MPRIHPTVNDRVYAYCQDIRQKLIDSGATPGTQPPLGAIVSQAIMETEAFKEWERGQKCKQ